MKKTFQELPGWEFDMDEVSANVYEVIAQNKQGKRVSAKGIDLDALIAQCKTEARRIDNEPER